jgi:hypothetical protein
MLLHYSYVIEIHPTENISDPLISDLLYSRFIISSVKLSNLNHLIPQSDSAGGGTELIIINKAIFY